MSEGDGKIICAEALINAREDRTVEQFAKDVGVSKATISRLEQGKLMSVEVYLMICKRFHWSADNYKFGKPRVSICPSCGSKKINTEV